MRPNIHQLSCLIRRHAERCDDERSDADLLALFSETRDEAAFEQLLRRYGSMVYAICRRALPTADAEDAYQATFLALVRRCRTVRRGGALGGWLHATATHAAAQIVRRNRRREAREQALARAEAAEPGATGDAELARILDEELAGLPVRYRDPIVLCRVRGATLAAAAEDLGLSVAGVWKRVQRGENLLRDRLVRRGVAAPVAGLAAVWVTPPNLWAARPELLDVARGTLARGSARSAALPAAWWCAGGVVALGAALAALAAAGTVPAAAPHVTAPVRTVPASLPVGVAAKAEPGKGWTVIRGVVTDADGRAVPKAKLGLRAHGDDIVLTERSDASGGYRFVVPDLFWNESDSVSVTALEPAHPHVRVPVLPPFEETRRVIPVRLAAAPRARPVADPVEAPGTAPRGTVSGNPLATGTVLGGRVVDGTTGRPVAGARVRFLAGGVWGHRDPVVPPVATDAEGRYAITVPHRNGTLAITASDDYRLLVRDATVPNPIAGEATELLGIARGGPELPTVRLPRGGVIRGTVRFPDGTPLAAGSVWCAERFGTLEPRSHRPIPVVGGEFTIRGCDPGRTYSVVVTDGESRYAAAATLKVTDREPLLTLSAVDVRPE
ncbi:sigma-70 family rna polymerase sigma factor : RNA polymerase sigma factor, sigma-70 family OS=Singulisphaera acidiphila (strain ATCC BAA-1392 / DSM 18658 / VKM B-2454 / MOB10) GN=Sinac_2497 PE=4 SV=1: Sigma70_r2: Sigma70_r4_2: CarboxypepD_reg [Gemmataceae bacterium]|nr:sigma-70 family rna polymerase sigma factor : RNA polymerase sigma factor, sigma-70 family OS=Singulisphaera acidiphila (strain ATCC BAA-1392 / DSM 18658 / VKM B-2454 / MOB10) GN=Sinac_2497 PE=4 SV=1: Sigma70_r2: Sigma70_r4_2: CarboxypepD_reg [Gemmataceae bacterium]VTU01255.1 sigma-70 family rna polymerase sigma factor : RNA polymerase sigma factor, sigma-70 family OS=Singulisphaera acidiphila (strain ATCC BAA-1392 / DSM 18658 / VKM B-2454 / MOB10) GN=Sinac_2497 PE=4 SV=1: Sigma70_r2: Sigma70_r